MAEVNNEVGLTAQDVRAICDVNASSKKGRMGVTGHKGIGWKSCFQAGETSNLSDTRVISSSI